MKYITVRFTDDQLRHLLSANFQQQNSLKQIIKDNPLDNEYEKKMLSFNRRIETKLCEALGL